MNTRRILKCFELASGLSLNFHKSCAVKGDRRERKKIQVLKWELLYRNKQCGGLNIGSIRDKNYGLLAKWVWRFDKEAVHLWKRVICAKYGVLMDILKWDWNCGSGSPAFTKAFGNLFVHGSAMVKTLADGIRVIVGRGDRARLWSDILVKGIPMKDAFLSIFSITVNKTVCIRDFWRKDGLGGKWEINLRRLLFNWQNEQWECCTGCLESGFSG
ncbi:hypothetical protein Ddye_019461 [Dipteronia dyeriana]|uniref:Uncharacterized protein n=1 Tax=Dipteronia dyeriana TaxID=168575 RepID=A0AAD9WV40_9ROSI|nr:hypothetical protein Ddye_019461 [Dipteronia dyeriana]